MTALAGEPPLGMGARVGPYEILGHLATGGMGQVYLARKTGIGGFERTVVLKVMLAHLTHDERFSAMFIDEARISSQLSHPNIVQVYDLARSEGGAMYLTMEHLQGQTVASCLKQSAQTKTYLPQEVAARVACDALSALAYAHGVCGPDGTALGFVHRDISPENLYVTYAGPTKVLDFGVAKVRDRIAKTQAGEFKGKVGYMAPEIILGEPVDARADLFSAGVVLFEMLTTRRLFHASAPATALHRVLQAPIPTIQSLRPEVDEELDRVVQSMLVRDPSGRAQSAEEIAERLERWLQSREGTQKHVGQWMRARFADALQVTNRIVSAVEGTGSINPDDLAEARRLGGDGLADTLVLELSTEEREGARRGMARSTTPLPAVLSEADSDDSWIGRTSILRWAVGAMFFLGLGALGLWKLDERLAARRAAFATGTQIAGRLVVEGPLAEADGSAYFSVKDEPSGEPMVLWATVPIGPGLEDVEKAIAASVRPVVALDLPELPVAKMAGSFSGRAFGVFTVGEGRPLAEVLSREVIPPDRGRHLLTEIGAIIAEAHEAGLVHGALDPGTIWVERADMVKVVGFQGGVVAQSQLGGRFRAPETRALEPSSPLVDQYAVSVLASEILKLSDQTAAVRVAPILAKAQAVEPIDRYRSFKEFWDALSDAIGKRTPKKKKRGA